MKFLEIANYILIFSFTASKCILPSIKTTYTTASASAQGTTQETTTQETTQDQPRGPVQTSIYLEPIPVKEQQLSFESASSDQRVDSAEEPQPSGLTKPQPTPALSPQPSDDPQLGPWEEDSLKLHNEYRNQLVTSNGSTLPPFSWREDLAEKAREWANRLVEKSKNEGNKIKLEHSSAMNWGTGENLYSTKNGDMGCGAAIDAWFNEWPLYKNEPIGQGDFHAYGHYTQLAWPDTKFIGCAYGDNGDNIRFTVCEYDPPGNVMGRKLDVFVKGKQRH